METKIENYFKEEELFTKEEINNSTNISFKESIIIEKNIKELLEKLIKTKIFVQKCIDEGVSEHNMKLFVSDLTHNKE